MKKILLILFIACSAVFAQAPAIQWQNSIGGSHYDYADAIIQTSDGGYMIASYSYSNISGDKTENAVGEDDFWIIKTDATGNIIWQNTIGGTNFENLSDVVQTSDGGYILGGTSRSVISGDKTITSYGGSDDYWVVKVDATGAIQWQNVFGGLSGEGLTRIIQTTDGGYLVGGNSSSGANGNKTLASNGLTDCWVIKLSSTGTIQWQRAYGGSDNDVLTSLAPTSDGGYILGARSASGISGNKTEANIGDYDYWVIKINSVGTILWQNTIGGTQEDYLYSISQTSDGGYIVAGHSESGISGDKTEASNGLDDLWILKLNSTGSIVWQNTIGGNSFDTFPEIAQTSDGGYILGSNSLSGISGDKTEASRGSSDYWILKLSSTGSIQWQKVIGGSNSDDFWGIDITSDNGCILIGNSISGISGDKTEANMGGTDIWMVKLGPECISPDITGFTVNDNNVCAGDSVTFTITGNLNGAGHWVIYSGSCNGTLVDTTSSNSVKILPSSSTTYFVRGEGGCVTPSTCSSVSVTVNSLPNVNAGADDEICLGENIYINATGAPNLSWDNGIGNVNPAAVSPINTTNYIVTGTDVNGCMDKDTVIITVNSLPNTFAGNDTLICPGNPATLQASGADNYLWIGLSTTNPQNINPVVTSSFIVTGFTEEGCSKNDTMVVEVSVLPLLNFDILLDTVCTSYAPVNLSASPSGGTFTGPGVSGTQLQPSSSGTGLLTVTYTFTNTDGCVADTSDQIFVSPCLNMEGNEISNITIYPNPANDFITIHSSMNFEALEIIDLTGKTVFISNAPNQILTVNTTSFQPGVYLLKISVDNSTVVHRIIKQ